MTSPAGDALFSAMLDALNWEDWEDWEAASRWWLRVIARFGSDIFL